MPSLKVSVAVGDAKHYGTASRFSKYENYRVMYEVTAGRLGGVTEPAELGYAS